MTPNLLNYLSKPMCILPLQLVDAVNSADAIIQSSTLVTQSGKRYPIISGVPSFVDYVPTETVESFCDELNHFISIDF